MPNLTLEGLPVHGDIVARYVILQKSEVGRCWVVMGSRAVFDYCWDVIGALDLTQPTRIVAVRRGKVTHAIRSWN